MTKFEKAFEFVGTAVIFLLALITMIVVYLEMIVYIAIAVLYLILNPKIESKKEAFDNFTSNTLLTLKAIPYRSLNMFD